jgi:WD40 repeat protein
MTTTTRTTIVAFLLATVSIAGTAPLAGAQFLHELPTGDTTLLAPTDATASKTDSLGDPLPEQAVLRFGTTRFMHASSIADMALSPDGTRLASIGSDDLVLWDVVTGKELWRKPIRPLIQISAASYGLRLLEFADEGTKLYVARNAGDFLMIDVETGVGEANIEPVHVVRPFPAKSIDVAQRGMRIAIGTPTGVTLSNAEGQILWDIKNTVRGRAEINGNDRLWFGGHFSYAIFSPDEQTVAVVLSSNPQQLQLHDAASGKLQLTIALAGNLVRMAFSPDGQSITATERDVAVRSYSTETGELIWERQVPQRDNAECYLSAIAYQPRGNLIAVGAPIGETNDILLLDQKSGEVVGRLTGHTWKPWALAFTSDGKRLYSGGWDGLVRSWDIDERKQLPLPAGQRATPVIAAAPLGKVLAYVDDTHVVHVVESNDNSELHKFDLKGATCTQLAFSADSSRLAAGYASRDDLHVVIWNLADGKVSHQWTWPKGRDPHSSFEALTFGNDGRLLAAAVFRQSKAYLFDTSSGNQVAEIPHKSIYGLSLSPDSTTLATAGWDSCIRFWNTTGGELEREVKVDDVVDEPGDYRMYAVQFSPDGTSLATADMECRVRIWSVADTTPLRSFKQPGSFVYGALAYSPDGSLIASGSAGGRVSLWDAATGAELLQVGQHRDNVYTLQFADRHRQLVSGGDDGICYLWDLRPALKVNDPGLDYLNDPPEVAYAIMRQLEDNPAGIVDEITRKIAGVTSLIDVESIVAGLDETEAEQRLGLAKILVEKDSRVEYARVVQRGMLLLERVATPEAIAALQQFSRNHASAEIKQLAAEALERLRRQGLAN